MQLTKALVFIASIPLVCTSLSGDSRTDNHFKTFMAPRSALRHLPHEYSFFHDKVYGRQCNKSQSTHLMATGFYRSTTEQTDAGQHFGSGKDNNGITIGNPADADINKSFFADRTRMMREASDPVNSAVKGVIEKGGIVFRPKQQQIGLRLDLHHNLCGVFDRCFVQMSTALVHIKNNLHVNICDEHQDTECGKLLARFFSGAYEQTEDQLNLQSPLTKLKICGGRSHFGFGDMEFNFGHKYHESEVSHVYLKLKLTVPTGREPNGDYLFDAIYGNGGHFGLGWQIDAAKSFDCTQYATVKVMGALMHTYLFEGSEIRTPSVKGIPFSQYYLAGRLGQINKPLFPAANVLTQSMRVKPGHQFEGLLAGSFKSSNFVIDAGYNLFWKDREGAWVKHWKDNVYGLALTNYRTDTLFGRANTAPVIDKEDIDESSVETPELISHTIYASLGYTMKIMDNCPISGAIGGSYEFGNNSSTFDSYSIWLKIGTSF